MKKRVYENVRIPFVKPLLPEAEDLQEHISEIWASGCVTNFGPKHNLLTNMLSEVLGSPNISLLSSGTTALMVALRALDLPEGSEVITTPFTFSATLNAISWSGLKPVFCDIEEDTLCIDPSRIEDLITENTSAIVGVHVYGFPCDVFAIEDIARKNKLKVVYDAAHAFLTKIGDRCISTFGDASMFSFHATKLFNTIEGGCITCSDNSLQEKISRMVNFGIKDLDPISNIGLNGKLNEIQASIGVLNLKAVEEERGKRRRVNNFYRKKLSSCKGVFIPSLAGNVTDSFQYFPILITEEYCLSRDDLYDLMVKTGIIARRYFYPLCSDYELYRDLPSSSPSNLPVANKIKNQVLCLPYYGDLTEKDLSEICNIINNQQK